ncbi:MAG: TlpA disulfide reductase family protein [Planctomycetota bacterium]|nr:TlpA disulfide reductase family protein [Planctomycetota bacterium]
MYPHERSLVKKYSADQFAIVGVNSEETIEAAREAVKKNQLSWNNFFDGGGTDGPIATRWNVSGWPTTYLIDENGVIRYKDVRGETLDSALEMLLEQWKTARDAEAKL